MAEEEAKRPGEGDTGLPGSGLPGPDQAANKPPGASRRRVRRTPIHGVLVAIDAPQIANNPWVVDAIDINANGLGLVLGPDLPEGSQVLLSFQLSAELSFSRLPAIVLHQRGASGGVRFESWPVAERLKLLEYLVGIYETIAEEE